MAPQSCTFPNFRCGVRYIPVLTLIFSLSSENITTTRVLPKTAFFVGHFSQKYWYYFNHCGVIVPQCLDFGEITRNNGHHTVQCHSRSPISVSMVLESLYATYEQYYTSCIAPFPRYGGLLVQFLPRQGVPVFSVLIRVNP